MQAELEGFRQEARAWLAENFPPSLKGKGAVDVYCHALAAGDADPA